MATYGFDENKNKIEVPPKTETGSLASLRTTDKSSLVAAVNECFQNASDGKSKLAAAIGNGATASMTWDQLISKVYKPLIYTKNTNFTVTQTWNSQYEYWRCVTSAITFPYTPRFIIAYTTWANEPFLTFWAYDMSSAEKTDSPIKISGNRFNYDDNGTRSYDKTDVLRYLVIGW